MKMAVSELEKALDKVGSEVVSLQKLLIEEFYELLPSRWFAKIDRLADAVAAMAITVFGLKIISGDALAVIKRFINSEVNFSSSSPKTSAELNRLSGKLSVFNCVVSGGSLFYGGRLLVRATKSMRAFLGLADRSKAAFFEALVHSSMSRTGATAAEVAMTRRGIREELKVHVGASPLWEQLVRDTVAELGDTEEMLEATVVRMEPFLGIRLRALAVADDALARAHARTMLEKSIGAVSNDAPVQRSKPGEPSVDPCVEREELSAAMKLLATDTGPSVVGRRGKTSDVGRRLSALLQVLS